MSRAAPALRGLAALGVALVAAVPACAQQSGAYEPSGAVLRGDIAPTDPASAQAASAQSASRPSSDPTELRPSLDPFSTRNAASPATDINLEQGTADEDVLPNVEQPLDATPLAAGPLALPPTTAARRRRTVEDEPFAPVGVRVGSFVVTPFAEIREGYDSNALRVPDGPGSWFTEAGAGFVARSDWSRHALEIAMSGGYTAYANVDGNNRPEAEATLRGRIDVSSQTRIDTVLRGVITTNPPGSVDSVAGAKEPPLIYETGADIGITHRFNRLELGVAGIVERQDYAPAELTDGTTESQADQNVTGYGVRLRGAYELMPGVKPFVQMVADRRVYDIVPDSDGFDRDSRGITASAGSELRLSELVTGSASLGYTWRTYSAPLLEDISGLVADAALRWQATGLTNVILTARSAVEETTLENASGDFVHEARIDIEHALRRWLIATVSVAYRVDDYEGADLTEETFTASAGFVYKLGRWAELTGQISHIRLNSNVAGNDYEANVAQLGFRLQR